MYATQSFFNDAKERRISISWLRDESGNQYDASKVWNGYQSLPVETTLRYINGEFRLYSYPIEELIKKRKNILFDVHQKAVDENKTNILEQVQGTLIDIEAEFQLSEGTIQVGFGLRSNGNNEIRVYYDAKRNKIFVDKSLVGQGLENISQHQMK